MTNEDALKFEGYWPDDDSTDYEPWERWSVSLFGEEAGESIRHQSDIDNVLRMSGLTLTLTDSSGVVLCISGKGAE